MIPERLAEITDCFSGLRVAVVGDFFLDKYLEVDASLQEISLETEKPAHQVVGVRHSPGAAGTVVRNLASLGASQLFALGFVGIDGEGYDLLMDLQELGCSVDGLLKTAERVTPTYMKPRDNSDLGLAGEHSRYDIKNWSRTSSGIEDEIISAMDRVISKADAVIIADQVEEQDYGVITSRVRECLSSLALRHSETVFWADSRACIQQFRNVIIKPNQFEALGPQITDSCSPVSEERLFQGLMRLRQQAKAPVVMTRGAEGMLVSEPSPTIVPGVRVEGPVDITGAGDSVSASAVLALASGATLSEAALIGNLVASISIQQLNTTGVARVEELPERLALWSEQNSQRY